MNDEMCSGVVVDAQEWDEWLAKVDAELKREVGIVSGDLVFACPRAYFVGWFWQGYEPAETAQAALDVARHANL